MVCFVLGVWNGMNRSCKIGFVAEIYTTLEAIIFVCKCQSRLNKPTRWLPTNASGYDEAAKP